MSCPISILDISPRIYSLGHTTRNKSTYFFGFTPLHMPYWTYLGHTLFDIHLRLITWHIPLNIPSLDMLLTNIVLIPRIYYLGHTTWTYLWHAFFYIPSWTGLRTYLGHTHLDIHFGTITRHFLLKDPSLDMLLTNLGNIPRIYSLGHTTWTYFRHIYLNIYPWTYSLVHT